MFNKQKMPTTRQTKRVIYNIRNYLFPNFVAREKDKKSLLDLINLFFIKKRLTSLVKKSLYANDSCLSSNDENRNKNVCEKVSKTAKNVVNRFIAQLNELESVCLLDAKAVIMGDPSAECYKVVLTCFPAFFTIFTYRIAHFLYTNGVPFLPRIMTEYAHSKTGIDINAGAKIGKYFFIDHGTGVVIGETAEIGDNCKIYQGVTLGALSLKYDDTDRHNKRHPTICNNVTIYANATILGGKTVVGDNSIIGGNAFVIRSVPANSKIVVEPTK